MTVPAQYPSTTSLGNGVTTVFPYGFMVFEATDMAVKVAGVTQVIGVQYQVTGLGNPTGGTIVFVTPPGSGVVVDLIRAMPYERETNFLQLGDLQAGTLNRDQDEAVLMIQQLSRIQGKYLTMPDGIYPAPNLVLPTPVPGSLLGWSGDGTGIVNVGPSGIGAGSVSDANVANNAAISGAKLSFLQAGVSAIPRSMQEKERDVLSVRDFGATGNGVTDDSAAVQNCVNRAMAVGGTVYFPAGIYNIVSTVVVNYDAHLVQNDGKGICIRGAGMNNTVIRSATAGRYALELSETLNSTAAVSFLTISDITFTGNGSLTASGSYGLKVQALLFMDFRNLGFYGLRTGMFVHDSVTWSMYDCIFNTNYNALICDGQGTQVVSTPNAVDLYHCIFYGNINTGAIFVEGCTINFHGGTVETNGATGSDALRFGVKLQDCGRYGGAGANFYGTYFEGNANVADVWITHTAYPATYNFHGCVFNKFTSPYSPNAIRVDAGTIIAIPAQVSVIGCSFQDRGKAASATDKYIIFYTGGTPVFLEESGNFFQSQVEKPAISTNRVFAHGKWTAMSNPVLQGGFNIDSIFRNGVGNYTINFLRPSYQVEKNMQVTMSGSAGFVQANALSTTSIQVYTFNTAAAAIDPGGINVVVME